MTEAQYHSACESWLEFHLRDTQKGCRNQCRSDSVFAIIFLQQRMIYGQTHWNKSCVHVIHFLDSLWNNLYLIQDRLSAFLVVMALTTESNFRAVFVESSWVLWTRRVHWIWQLEWPWRITIPLNFITINFIFVEFRTSPIITCSSSVFRIAKWSFICSYLYHFGYKSVVIYFISP